MPLNDSDGQDVEHPEFRDPRTTLGVEAEMVSEEEARKRREQLNRRPSYRMILKDLETVGDKPMKKELEENSQSLNAEQAINCNQASSSLQQQLPDSSTDCQNFASNGIHHLMHSGLKPGLPVGVGMEARVSNSNPIAHLPPPTQTHHPLGQLNLIAPPPAQGRLIADIPSQPQPQISSAAPQPLLTAVNNLEMLGLKAPENLSAAFSQNEWQNNLIATYNRQQLQQPQQQHMVQQNQSNPSLSAMNNQNTTGPSIANLSQQQHIGPPHGMGTRQGSASLTSFTSHRSDTDETSKKRQVRLLKNREAAKECRRKKKEYVKCLENRVAVLENQNKALIEELKTLKELYCRKEKGSDM